ncbi:ATP-binding protein [Streptomyces longispororuber]|uniref:ATP-binding protein n=1 Tax=Streptomyces longispororuber TaxID=68230 RepID=UPI0037025ED7
MKQSAAKTLGVAALGAAFAALGAGAAHAAPAAVPDPATALETVTTTLPLDQAAGTLPAGAPESLTAGQDTLTSGVSAPGPAVDRLVPALPTESVEGATKTATAPGDDEGEDGRKAAGRESGEQQSADPVAQLLGGLPTQGLPTQGLPTQGLGLPL